MLLQITLHTAKFGLRDAMVAVRGVGTGGGGGGGEGSQGPPNFSDDAKKCPFSQGKVPCFIREKAPFRKINISMGQKHLILKENLNRALLIADISHINLNL